jgi:hypothetical protein
MNKRLPILAALLFLMNLAMAQDVPAADEKEKKSCSCAFESLFSVGDLEGQLGSALQLQTIQGIRYGKWFFGIGAGLDYYNTRSIPLFVDLRREFMNYKAKPFVYADGGYHFAWPRDRDKELYGTKIDFDGGLYYDLGLGIRFGVGKKGGVLFSAGYSYKYLREVHISQVCNFDPPCQMRATEWYRYRLNRLSLKIGVQL